MPVFFLQAYRSVMRWAHTLDRDEWLVVIIVVTIIGVMCMRGFGSRKNY